MKLLSYIALAIAALTVPGLASAQSYGGFGAKKTAPSFSHPPSPSTVPSFPAPPKPPSPPPAPAFKPYEPYKGSSVYSAPRPSSSGAKDCELSVYVNACGRRR